MKQYTIAVGFDRKNSDDGMFDDNRRDETRYLMPVKSRKKCDEAFVSKEDLDASNTYVSREDAEKDFTWIKRMHDSWWNDEWLGNEPIFSDELIDEFPDHYLEFIFPIGAEEIKVN